MSVADETAVFGVSRRRWDVSLTNEDMFVYLVSSLTIAHWA